MKLAVATPEEMGFVDGVSQAFPGWKLFPTDFVRPSNIRKVILTPIDAEERLGAHENFFVTMNRTVLDMVTHPEIKNAGPMGYEDVCLWPTERGTLVPLLEFHGEEWLSHFALGDLFERGF